jgi:hypothetical protein
LSGLRDRRSVARHCPHRAAPETEAAVLALRGEIRRGPHRIAGRLQLASSTVYAILARHGISRLSRLDRTTGLVIRQGPAIRCERTRPAELIHIDVKKLGRIPDGGGWCVHGRQEKRGAGNPDQRVGYGYLCVTIDDHEAAPTSRCSPTSAATPARGSSNELGRTSPSSASRSSE